MGVAALNTDLQLKMGEELLNILTDALEKLENAGRLDSSDYKSYLHGQIYGLATALRLLYPGPGNFGEKAALLLRPVITEHVCICEEKDSV